MEELLSVNEFARRAGGLSPFTVHSWLSSGKLTRTKLGRRTMIRASELQRLIAEGDGKKSPGRPRPQATPAQTPRMVGEGEVEKQMERHQDNPAELDGGW